MPLVLCGQNLSVDYEVEKHFYLEFKGNIDTDIPITMHLEIEGTCGFKGVGRQWRNRVLTGWYFYDKKMKKIPLIG
ncbi:MAG: hypothetical protein AAFU67_04870, partial [Bacteroidota bacterium]